MSQQGNENDYSNVDEDNVEALIKDLIKEGGDSESDTDLASSDTQSADDVKEETEPKAKDEAEDKDKGDESPESESIVKSRDGKHEIPYSVLANERTRNLELQRELEKLKAEQAKQDEIANNDKSDQDTGTSTDIDEFDLEAFREEFGDEAAEAEKSRRDSYAGMEKRQKELENELAESKKWRQEQEAKQAESAAKTQQEAVSEVNEAIDSIPELREWRDSGDPMWNAAVALDNRLQDDPEFEGMSYSDRFNIVVDRLTGRKTAQKNHDDKDANDKFDQKLKEKEQSGRPAPSTLSDLPGGQAADQSEHQSLERMTTSQLEAKFSSMSEEQQAEYLARL